MDNIDGKHLKRIPDKRLHNPEHEDDGRAYGDLFTKLQIRPEGHEEYFEENVKPWRNRKKSLSLIQRGGPKTFRKLSEDYLTAYGSITWRNDRGWLFEELLEGDEPLYYVLTKERREGDHDRFFVILDELWKRMRSLIFEVKRPESTTSDTITVDEDDSGSITIIPVTKQKQKRKSTASDRPAIPVPQPHATTRDAHRSRRLDRELPSRSPSTSSPARHELPIPGTWTASQTEKALLRIILDVHKTRMNSHPRIFERLFEQHLERLMDIDYIDQLQIQKEKDGAALDNHEAQVEGADVTMSDAAAVNDDVDELQVSPSQKPQAQLVPIPISRSIREKPPQPRPPQTDHLSLPSLLAPSLMASTTPNILIAFITPFNATPSIHAQPQPYIWPDMPVTPHPNSYNLALAGIRLRANVPDHRRDDSLVLVLASGWDDSVRLVRRAEDWISETTGVWGDVKRAAERGAGSWKVRIGVFQS